jgi:hypothetical protein
MRKEKHRHTNGNSIILNLFNMAVRTHSEIRSPRSSSRRQPSLFCNRSINCCRLMTRAKRRDHDDTAKAQQPRKALGGTERKNGRHGAMAAA